VGAVEVPEPAAGAASLVSWIALCTLARRLPRCRRGRQSSC
jgi:hypothetical protein